MKLKILALTTLLTLCTVSPVEASSEADFRVSALDDPEIVIARGQRRHRHYNSRYRDGWKNQRWRYHRRYRRSQFYYPLYRGEPFFHPHYQNYRSRHRYGRYYRPSRSYIQLRIGF